MDFSLWTGVEFAHGCAVVPHQDFEKAFFIICKVLVGLGVSFFLFSEWWYIYFYPYLLHKENKKLNTEVIRSSCRNINGPK